MTSVSRLYVFSRTSSSLKTGTIQEYSILFSILHTSLIKLIKCPATSTIYPLALNSMLYEALEVVPSLSEVKTFL